MQQLMAIITTLLVILVIGYMLYSADNLLNLRYYRVGYTGSNLHLCVPQLKMIIKKYVPSTEEVTFVESGAGFARIARAMARSFKWKRLIALEIRWYLRVAGRLATIWQNTPIHFSDENALAYPYPKQAVVYFYLSTKVMDELYKKGLLDGLLVISLTFAIPNVSCTERVRLQGWQKHLWVYDFRNK